MSEIHPTTASPQALVSQELNKQILTVLSSKVRGFEKAFVMASAIQVIRERLTPEFMKPIMALQGLRLGFKTDKDKTGGYSLEEVKLCLMDAVLLGLEPTGNEFNIIAGNMYPTREGFGSLLKKKNGLKYSLSYSTPIFTQDKTLASCNVKVSWELNGDKSTEEVSFGIKSNAYASVDSIIGKAERKAKRWLFNKLEGTDIPDGDVNDISHEVIKDTPTNTLAVSEEKQVKRISDHIAKSMTVAELEKCQSAIKEGDEALKDAYNEKLTELTQNQK